MDRSFRFPRHLLGFGFGRTPARSFRWLLAATALALMLTEVAQAQRVALPGSVNAVAAQDETKNAFHARVARPALTATEAAAPMKINLVLAMRAPDELRRRVAAGEIIAPAEMAAKYLPSRRTSKRWRPVCGAWG